MKKRLFGLVIALAFTLSAAGQQSVEVLHCVMARWTPDVSKKGLHSAAPTSRTPQ